MTLSSYVRSKWFKKAKSRDRPIVTPNITIDESSSATTSIEPHELLFPSWPPLYPREILSRRQFYQNRFMNRKYCAPRGVFDDSPLYALYRIYEWIMTGHTINIRNELEQLWWQPWPVSSIPDPGEQGDPERYAVLACIPALLVESFNERNRLGLRRAEPHSILSLEEQLQWAATPEVLETVPSWTEAVAPLEELLHIPDSEPERPELAGLFDPEPEPAFKEKNILIMKPHIHFI